MGSVSDGVSSLTVAFWMVNPSWWNFLVESWSGLRFFQQVKMRVEQRVRTQLRRCHKLTRAQVYERFPGHNIYSIRPVQTVDLRHAALSARLGIKNIGKPCAGEPYARFVEGS